MFIKTSISAIILAAGFSERMKMHKALLRFDETECFLSNIVKGYLELEISNIIVVVNEDLSKEKIPIYDAVKLVINYQPQLGKLFSLQLALEQVPKNSASFINDVDQPFICPSLLNCCHISLASNLYVTPTYRGESGHPIIIGAHIANALRNTQIKNQTLKDILKSYPRIKYECNEESILYNINTPEEYRKLFKREPEIIKY